MLLHRPTEENFLAKQKTSDGSRNLCKVRLGSVLGKQNSEGESETGNAVPVASLRWHYPDQVQGCFSPGHVAARTPSEPPCSGFVNYTPLTVEVGHAVPYMSLIM